MNKLKDLTYYLKLKNFEYDHWRENIRKAKSVGLIYTGIELDPKIILTITIRYFDQKLKTHTSSFSIDRLKLISIN